MSSVAEKTGSKQPDSSGESKEIIVRQQGQELIARAVLGEMSGICLHNFGDDPKFAWKMAALATAGNTEDKSVALREPIALEYFYAHKVYLRDRKDPSIENACVRTVLFDADGSRYAFVSTGIAEDLAALTRMFGYGRYNPPIQMQVVEKKTSNNFTVLRLVPVE